MGKFEQEAKDLLAAIGGKENVTAVTHCATRMRFVLGDDKKADVKTIEAIPAVKGTFTNAGQFQVIIGNDVPIFYNDFTAVSGIEGVSKEAAKSAQPAILEPMMLVTITVPEENLGDVMGHVTARRGRVDGMEAHGNSQIVRAYVPLAEMFGYATTLRSATQGRGTFMMVFDHYEDVPKSVQEEIIKKNSGEA